MKYFNFELLVFVCVAASCFWAWRCFVLKKHFLLMMLEKIVLKKQAENENLTFFSGRILQQLSSVLARQKKIKRQQILTELQKGEYQPFLQILSYDVDKIGCLAHFDIKKALESAERKIKENPQNVNLLILLGFLYVNNFDYDKAQIVVDDLQTKKLNKWQKAYFLMMRAKLEFYLGDMHEACADVLNALRFFKKQRLGFEEAGAYGLLGEIYRACAVYDLSQMMFEVAQNLFDKMNLSAEKAKISALLGMLLAGQKRFKEAAAHLKESRNIFKKLKFHKAEAEVVNQQALNYLLTGKNALAMRYAQKALDMHIKCENIGGVAQSFDLMAMCASEKKSFKQALQLAESAAENYLQVRNYSAYAESLFLKATLFFKSNNTKSAEKICRELLKLCSEHKTCFHIANIYAMLGNICLQKNNLHKAKSWFQQSLAREQSDERYAGAALDYFNLALVERKLCNMSEMKNNMEKALEAAKQSNDENLCAIISKQIAKIS